MKKTILSIMAFLCAAAASAQSNSAQKDYTKYALPIVGSQNKFELSNGNLYPAAALPFAMNNWSPQTALNNNRWFYNYTDDQINGLRLTHQPCPWAGDYGCFILMPTVGEKKFLEKDRQSWFSHKTEVAKPYYYKVFLADHDVTAEMAPTERACVMQFTFPRTDKANVVVDAFDQGSMVQVIPSENKVVGYSSYMVSNGSNQSRIPDGFKNFFVIVFDKPFTAASLWLGKGFVAGDQQKVEGKHSGAVLTFSTAHGEKITARIATSYISPEQAELNLDREVGGKGLAEVCEQSKNVWNSQLGRFVIEDDKADDLDGIRMFYTTLYRLLLFPHEFFEYDRQNNIVHYSPFDGKVYPGRFYTDTGFWDTYRAVHPFFNLFYPKMSTYFMESMVNCYKESGWLPEWTSPGHFNSMVGSSSTSVVAAAYLAGIPGMDMTTLWKAVDHNVHNAHPTIESVGRAGIKEYEKLGYLPNDIGIKESASRTLEYAYADFCMMRLAQALGKDKATVEEFHKKALSYQNLFYKKFNLMAGRNSAGEFRPDFNPFAYGGDFTEGCSWQHTWAVMHDPVGLAKLMGGDKEFLRMLDSLFVAPPNFDYTAYGKVIHEIREMQVEGFGQYAHNNEPSHHIIYLYDWTSQPWKAQYWVRQVMDKLYRPTADGYCGDEDTGQTSAWYVLSAMGFYSTCPVTGEFTIGSPLFRKMSITLDNGKQLVLEAPNNSPGNVYINNVTVNGKPWDKNFFPRTLLQQGGVIKFDMNDKPNKKRGSDPSAWPYSLTK